VFALFYIASEADIKRGETTDVYFVRTKQVLEAKRLSDTQVLAEVTTSGLPKDWSWAVLCGVEEVAHLLEGLPVNVDTIPEGTIFHCSDHQGYRLPVMTIEGPYGKFCEFEAPLLGLLCQASGISTMAARVRRAAGDKLVISFGVRRMHPVLAPMIDRAAYMGGLDGASSLIGARTIGKSPIGTMPHALVIVMGDQVAAWKAFDEIVPTDAPRIALVDTYCDEKMESIMAADALGKKLYGVRLDTPGSRRGNFAEIVREVKWELHVRGYDHVKVIASGGLDDQNIAPLMEAGVDGFGVGTSVSNAPTIDFALDIVEKEGKPVAKRGKLGGRKQVFRCPQCLVDRIEDAKASPPKCPTCHGSMQSLLKPLIRDGKIVAKLISVEEIRKNLIDNLAKLK
jgi:nicotinate phosphoribosyltransferase